MSHSHHVPSSDEWLAEHMQEAIRLLRDLVFEVRLVNTRLERLDKLVQQAESFPQATQATVTSP